MGLSNAERQRRYIARLKAQAAQAGGCRGGAPGRAAPPPELAAARARIADLEKQLTEARLDGVTQAQAFRDARSRRAPKLKAEKAALPPDEARERRIKALSTENRNLKAKLRAMQAYHDEAATHGVMPQETARALAKVLHPDRRRQRNEAEREADLDEAGKLFFAWRSASKKAAKR